MNRTYDTKPHYDMAIRIISNPTLFSESLIHLSWRVIRQHRRTHDTAC